MVERLKILVAVHGYPGPGGHNAGAERSLQVICEWLAERGHEVRVATPGRSPEGTQNGVLIEHYQLPSETKSLYRWADIVITHLDLTKNVVRLAKQRQKPVVHLVHNHRQLRANYVPTDEKHLAVFNAEWTKEASKWEGQSIVIYPPFEFGLTAAKPGEFVTLVNLTKDKGAELFYDLAEMLPDIPFLGVRGAYGIQVAPPYLSNLLIAGNTHEMSKVYGQTRVILMPSVYESFGRVGIEAMANGIPVVASPTPGLLESLGWAGIFVESSSASAWKPWVERLMNDPSFWRKASIAARRRAAVFGTDEGLRRLERKMEEMCRTKV